MFCIFRETRKFCCCVTNGIKIDTIVMTKWWNFGIYRFVIVVISGFVYCILHVCGGDPHWYHLHLVIEWYSPRMWRWSCMMTCLRTLRSVFSTYVEVILIFQRRDGLWSGILHVCGGDPLYFWTMETSSRYSPRMWRWSWHLFGQTHQLVVFSTYVEVILHLCSSKKTTSSILHVCGGDPQRTRP